MLVRCVCFMMFVKGTVNVTTQLLRTLTRFSSHPACITNASQILETKIEIASNYTWFPLHPLLRNVDTDRPLPMFEKYTYGLYIGAG